ncbi:amidohydrolase [Microbacterium sp. zg.Y1090]|uniref:amidohydrolase n=1 Tax=Microbacterium TaxID=33882 RepID=UPI00214B67BF|nr:MULTISPECIES: amidohydrolase [unclassified Microbacterium]MCR2812719.1 amidohydrolase [Microbacterium sp. zg.Y1084]MCR2817487.1 amidohydrolase [Microbacterium sp. zg.Y1090]MDL5485871.1 amidohydrolase [Microbacterium sp. zg-Y1211]WIM29030.1 amidohydrolase [Microbacterium sp. zg-Y1090]
MHTTLYTNGLLYLGEGRFSEGAVLTRGDRIAAVLAAGDPLPAADETVDLAGGTLLPGFQDAHVHPLLAGLQLLSIDLHTVHDRGGYLRLIGDYAAAHPELPVLSGGGWFGDVFPGGFPTAAELDAVVPDRPVVLHSHDAHGAWVNTAALRAAGIDAGTPDPVGGRILRDADGAPTGMLLEAATAPVTALLAEPDLPMLALALRAAQQRLHAAGITAWQDAAVGPSDLGPDALPVYEHLDREGLLTGRVVLALWWDRERGVEQIAELITTRERLRASARLDAGTVKVMIDGMVENHTAAMLEPFTGHPDDRGIRFIEPAALAALTVALDAAGFQIHFHAVGDAAVRDALDALEAARLHNGRSGNRHHIAHLDLVHPSDAPRFRELDATANVTALWARRDKEIITRKLPLLGDDRAGHHFPFGTLRRHGARIVGGSDWPVTAPDPLWAVKTAVTRTGVAEDPHAIGNEVLTVPLLPDEAIPLGVALDAYLAEAAFINRLDGETGTLRVGAAADLVWVDRDLRHVDELGSAAVMRTVVGGKLVYRAD